jgi:F-type H+-transporting ATPase subunit b
MFAAMQEAENWVAVAFLCFLALLGYLGLHRKVFDSLDARQSRIKAELDEAVRLREEAKALLADFERKGREAEGEAAAIIASAKAEAERLAAEAKTRMEDFVMRRTKMAEIKIAQAEAQAVADVRAAAADAAVAAAGKILATSARGKVADDLLAQSIEDVKQKFN